MFKERSRAIKILFHNLIPTLLSDPKFFFKRVFLELKSTFVPLPQSPLIKEINGIKFEFDFNYCSHVKRFYFGTYEARLVRILKTFLKEGDTFIDVGANIGYITAVAAGCVGKKGAVHSFEPIPEYFQKIKKIAEMNKGYKIIVNPFAIGDEEGKIKIYISSQIGCDTVISAKADGKNFLEVPVKRLDNYIIENKIHNIKIIKIDVEGFEFPVLKGLEEYFLKCRDNNFYPLVLCEIHPDWLPLVGSSLQNVFEYMAKFSYYPFDIIKLKRRISISEVEREPLINVAFKFCG